MKPTEETPAELTDAEKRLVEEALFLFVNNFTDEEMETLKVAITNQEGVKKYLDEFIAKVTSETTLPPVQ